MNKSGSNKFFSFIILVTLFFSVVTCSAEELTSATDVPVEGMVTMLDLGAKKCTPCKMMAPILVKMEEIYKEKAAIVFIDVWENRDEAGRFGIRAIPTQIFFNEAGEEVYRHTGFLGEKEIVAQLKKMGVEQ
ncbi:MAG: thioredoxin family protein [Desulfobacterales bacterium]|nr:thioredoxin family protein [Desulfobacterales bacterium]